MAKVAKLLRTCMARLRWQSPHGIVGGVSDPATMARSGAYLFGSGATLALIWLFLPVSGQVDTGAMLAHGRRLVRDGRAADRRLRPDSGVGLQGVPLLLHADRQRDDLLQREERQPVLVLLRLGSALRAPLLQLRPTPPGTCCSWASVTRPCWSPTTGSGNTIGEFAVAVEDSAAQWTIAFGTLVVATALFGLLKERLDGLIERLSDAVKTDPLTGLLNRRGFEEAFELEVERARRLESPLTLLVGDLDHFKMLNDRLGHPAGDRALELMGEALTAGVRRIDRVGRMGGEEFALILPETDEHEALRPRRAPARQDPRELRRKTSSR